MPNKITKQQFENSLIEVRKAFRLLYMYQKRILDIVIFIQNKWNLKPDSGMPWPLDHNPKNTKGKHVDFEASPWVWLPLYYYDFFFTKDFNNKPLEVGIIIQSDTGFFDVSQEIKNPDISQFLNPEESETRIILGASNGKWDSKAIRENKSFGKNKIVYPEDPSITIDDVNIIAKAYPLDKFFDENTTEETLKDFVEFCESKGIFGLKG